MEGAGFLPLPQAASLTKNYSVWEKLFLQYLRTNRRLKIYQSPLLKEVSAEGETEREFLIRMGHLAHEKRDREAELLKKKYEARFQTLENQRMRARQALEARADQRKLEAVVSAGTAILSALLGRKTVSAATVSRVGTAVKSTGRAVKSGEAIAKSQESLEAIEDRVARLEQELSQELSALSAKYDQALDAVETVEIRPAAGGVTLRLFALAWAPE